MLLSLVVSAGMIGASVLAWTLALTPPIITGFSRLSADRNFRHAQEVTEQPYRRSMITFGIVLPMVGALCAFMLLID